MAKKVLAEAGLAQEDTIDFETKRRILWVARARVAEWSFTSVQLVWKDEGLKQAGIKIEGKFLNYAINEQLQAE